MSELFWSTVTADMRLILNEFSRSQIGAKFYLAGGTTLALQLGHRLSVDLDFFSPTEDIPTLRPALEKPRHFQPTGDLARANLVYLARDVRVGFYGYGYELVAPLAESENARLASIEDIALMKLDALLARAAPQGFLRPVFHLPKSIPAPDPKSRAPKISIHHRDFETQSVKRLDLL